jgi:hypothetical protein
MALLGCVSFFNNLKYFFTMLNKIKNPKLRISESIQFIGDVLSVCKKSNPTELNIQTQWTDLDQSFKPLNNSFKKSEASLLTAELAAQDDRRDNAIVCLRKLANGFTNHHDDDKQNAGRQILLTIDKYGRQISKINYQAETSILDNLVDDLKNEAENAAAVELLGLSDTVAEIKDANGQFSAIYLDRVGEDASKDVIAAGELVEVCMERYNILVKHIEAHATINPSDEINSLIKNLNELIERFNRLLARREGRNNAAAAAAL